MGLLSDDVWLRMPPRPLEYQGREQAATFLATIAFRGGRRYRLVPTRANGSPAFGTYVLGSGDGNAHAAGLLVASLSGPQIDNLTRFENTVFSRFGLPDSIPDR